MKKHLTTVAIFLLAGAVVNVGVAWGIAILAEWPSPVLPIYTDEPQWPRNVPAHWPPVRSKVDGKAFGFHLHRYVGCVTQSEMNKIDVYRVGWPSVALQWESWSEIKIWGFSPTTITNRFVDGHLPAWHVGLKPPDLLIPQLDDQWRRLPIRPATWLGLSVNTLFYASLLWLVIPGPFVLRRLIRQRRGLCPKCAYPMGESAVCSECGVPFAPNRLTVLGK